MDSTKERLQMERRRRRMRVLKRTLCFFILVGLVAGVYKLAHEPWFAFARIKVSGMENLGVAEVKQIVNLDEPFNPFLLDRARLEKGLSGDFRVEKVTTSYHWPNILLVEITERRPALYIASAYGAYAQIDFYGYVLSIGKGIRDAKVPVVTGVNIGNAYLGEQVQTAEIIVLTDFLRHLSPELLADIAEISVDANTSVVKILLLSGVPIILGPIETIQGKTENFITICNEIKSRDLTGYYIDLTFAKPYIKVRR